MASAPFLKACPVACISKYLHVFYIFVSLQATSNTMGKQYNQTRLHRAMCKTIYLPLRGTNTPPISTFILTMFSIKPGIITMRCTYLKNKEKVISSTQLLMDSVLDRLSYDINRSFLSHKRRGIFLISVQAEEYAYYSDIIPSDGGALLLYERIIEGH